MTVIARGWHPCETLQRATRENSHFENVRDILMWSFHNFKSVPTCNLEIPPCRCLLICKIRISAFTIAGLAEVVSAGVSCRSCYCTGSEKEHGVRENVWALGSGRNRGNRNIS
jgi:hypothetical protein